MKTMKKTLCVLLSLTLILLSVGFLPAGAAEADPAETGTNDTPVFYLGDSNRDGCVNIMDATHIQRTLAGFSTKLTFKGESLSDTNSNGRVDIVDATLIQRYLVNLPVAAKIGEPTAVRTMTFKNGYAHPFVDLDGYIDSEYTNEGSDVIRFVGIEPKFENFNGSYDANSAITLDLSQCYVVIPTDQTSVTEYSK